MCKENYIQIKDNAGIPKYKQLMKSIIDGIEENTLKIGDKIPSINHVSEEYCLSRSTVEKAYVELRNQKIIKSIKGKGFYIAKTQLQFKKDVLFLVNQIDPYVIRLLNDFTSILGKEAKIDLDTYSGDSSVFKDVLERKKNQYDQLVVLLNFENGEQDSGQYPKDVLETLESISPSKLILVSKARQFSGKLGQVYQDFEGDFYKVLRNGFSNFKTIERLVFIQPDNSPSFHTKHFEIGLKRFCAKYHLEYLIKDKICGQEALSKKDLYLLFSDLDLIQLIDKVKEQNFVLGEDIDIVSCGDSALKKYLGISVIEINYEEMAKKVSEMLMKNLIQTVNVDFIFVKRTY